MTEQEKNALDTVLGLVDNITVNENHSNICFNGNTYVVSDTDGGEIIATLDTFEELIEYIEENGLM